MTAFKEAAVAVSGLAILGLLFLDRRPLSSPTPQSAATQAVQQAVGTGLPLLPLKASSNNRYLVGQNNVPFLMVGDGGGQTMFTNISLAGAATYLADRQAHGYNAIWCNVLGSNTGGRSNGSTYDGILPFTGILSGGNYDVATPNSAYFARVDAMVNLAATYGIVVLMDAMDNNSWLSTYRANGNSAVYSFGAYLGNRYKNFKNVIWMTGNDFQTWNTTPGDNALAENVMAGIAGTDYNHIQTNELHYNISGSCDDPLLESFQGMASAYTYYPSYYEVLHEYNTCFPPVPTFMVEGYYEGVTYGNLTPTTATNLMLRKVPYWVVLSGGSAGYFAGDSYYDFHAGWQEGIDSKAATQLGYFSSFMQSFAWYSLVPDQTNEVVTAGYGTATGNGFGNIQTDNYVATGRIADGSLVLSYCPARTTITVDMTKLRGTITARWYDPTANMYLAIGSFSNTGTHDFATPGNNSAGDPDWVLVLTA
jgi:hypothetical protein